MEWNGREGKGKEGSERERKEGSRVEWKGREGKGKEITRTYLCIPWYIIMEYCRNNIELRSQIKEDPRKAMIKFGWSTHIYLNYNI